MPALGIARISRPQRARTHHRWGDFTDLEKWLPECRLLISDVAGPFADDEQNRVLRRWIEDGGRWPALHGSSGGRAVRDPNDPNRRRMMKTPYHETLGGFFINHPPIRRFRVDVTQRPPLDRGLPPAFETIDERCMIELQQPPDCQLLLTAELGPDTTLPGCGLAYDEDTALMPGAKTRAIGFVRDTQPSVDESVASGGFTPLTMRGSWETDAFAS